MRPIVGIISNWISESSYRLTFSEGDLVRLRDIHRQYLSGARAERRDTLRLEGSPYGTLVVAI